MQRSGESAISASDGWFTGEDQSLRWTIYDADPLTEVSPNVAKNITGWTITFKLAASVAGTALLTKTAALTTPASGICTVSVAAADYGSVPAGTYYYTLSRTDSGQNQVLAWGTAVVNARVA